MRNGRKLNDALPKPFLDIEPKPRGGMTVLVA
jgi:hypothetical protein